MKKNIALYFLCAIFLFIGFGCSKESGGTLAGTRWEDNYRKDMDYGSYAVLEFVSETKVVHYYTFSSTGTTYEAEYSYTYKHPEVIMSPPFSLNEDFKGLISENTMIVFEPSTGYTVGTFIKK